VVHIGADAWLQALDESYRPRKGEVGLHTTGEVLYLRLIALLHESYCFTSSYPDKLHAFIWPFLLIYLRCDLVDYTNVSQCNILEFGAPTIYLLLRWQAIILLRSIVAWPPAVSHAPEPRRSVRVAGYILRYQTPERSPTSVLTGLDVEQLRCVSAAGNIPVTSQNKQEMIVISVTNSIVYIELDSKISG